MKTKQIKIPSTQDEITLGQYQDILKFSDSVEDEIEVGKYIIQVLCGLTDDEVKNIHKKDYDDIIEITTKMLNKKSVWRRRFRMNGIEYGFIPNLDEITLGEYVDLDLMLKEDYSLHRVMAILYRPIVSESFNRYTIMDYTGKEDHELMLEAPLDVVNGTMVFFYDLGNDLLGNMEHYLNKHREKITESSNPSEKNGDGIVQSMQSQMEVLETLMKQLKQTSIQPSLSFHSPKKSRKLTTKY